MKKPLFSCVIPVKGRRPFFDEALQSLYTQGMGDDLEIIIQDGDVEPDKGQSDALNKGFAKAKGEWLFWLNADDVLLPGALVKVRDFINRAERVERVDEIAGDGNFMRRAECVDRVEWIAGDMVVIDGEGKVVRCQKDRGSYRAYEGRPIRVFGPSSFFRRELFERIGGFDVNLRYCMDTDLWCRFREAGAWFKKTGSYVWGFREHDGSTTAGAKKPGEQARQDAEVQAMHERRGVRMTALAVRALRVRRIWDGSFIKAVSDTMRFKGKNWSHVK